MKKYLFILAFMAPMVSNAGYIAPDMNEWELRGSITNVGGHLGEAAADTGWTWASLSDWAGSGLEGFTLAGIDLVAFASDCSLAPNSFSCFGFLSTQSAPGVYTAVNCATFVVGSSTCSQILIANTFQNQVLRVAFRAPVSTVPEPTSAALLVLGLLGLGVARRVKR